MKKRMIKFDTIKLSSTDQGGVQEKKIPKSGSTRY